MKIRKFLTLLLCVVLLVSNLAGAAFAEETTRIGVLIYDATDSEVIAFRHYYEDYIEQHYNVDFIYSEAIATAEEEVTAVENMIAQRCVAIISMSDQDRESCMTICEEAGVWFTIAAASLTDEQYEAMKDYTYYVGSIGPDMTLEEEVGYQMAKYYIDAGNTNFILYAGGYPYVTMHLYRTNGFIRAFEEAGAVYTPGANGSLGTFESDTFTIQTFDGFPTDAGAFFGTVSQMVSAEGVEVILTAALGVEFFAASVSQINPSIKIATVGAFSDAYKAAFDAEPAQCDYLAGKFASSIGPAFIATLNALEGNAFRTADGSAFRLNQDYWIATNTEEFDAMYELSADFENPAYDAETLNTMLVSQNPDVTYDDFAAFVSACSYEDLAR